LASTRELKKALRILKKAPAEMEQNHKKRTSRIKRVKMKGSLSAVCRLVRDLSARGKVKSLNTTERRALDFFKDILLREWSISIGMTMDDARKELQKMLKESHAKLPAEG
jgi:RNA polymerase-interacting CarD/CdnL/TRCF family regulator